VDLVKTLADIPLGEVIYTDIATDGMLQGPNLAAIARMKAASPHPLIASGGVSRAGDIRALARLGLFGAITGKALYDGRLALEDALAAAREAPG
jgi:phosphoribosylformimino-5-aminoimidazole carboxamide ribotide isomerase